MTNNNSPYSRVGAKLVDMGYSAIPVLPQSKRPGARKDGRWYGEPDWQRYCDRLPTSIEIGIWEKWPEAGVCVALGYGGLVAIDVDCDREEVVAAIQSVMPDSPVQKTGKKGYTGFYRASPSVKSCAFNIRGDRALDLLAHGKQTILPPTLHPDTARSYAWVTMATLEDTTVDRLPMLPDDISARLGAVLAEFGYTSPVERPPVDGDGGIWREVNDAALLRLDDWVPALGIDAKRGHDGRYRGRAIWKKAENANVGFSAQGIKDWGSDIGHTALDIVMLAHSSDFPTAEKWLRERLGFKELAPLHFTFRKAPEPVFVEVPKPTITANLPKLDPWDHKVAGGLLETTAQWIYSISFVPSRELSLLAAIGIQAAFQGRRYVGPTGLSSNLYLIGLASTGSGKNGPMGSIRKLLDAGMSCWRGSGDIASDSVVEKRLRTKPSCIFSLDEIGTLLQQNSSKGAAAHLSGRKKTLLELYTSSNIGDSWLGKDRAGDDVLSSDSPIYMPCLSIFGVSTQEEFFKGVTEQNLRDGLLNRLTVVSIPPCDPLEEFIPKAKVPQSLLNAYTDAFSDWRPVGKPVSERQHLQATIHPLLQHVEFADQEAKDRAKKVWEWQQDYIRDIPSSDGFIRRAYEQALKLAVIRAVSRDFSAPAVTVEDVEFGAAIVESSAEKLSNGMKDFMHGSEFEENCKLLVRHVDASPKGLTYTQLTHRAGVGKIDSQKLNAAIAYLTKTGRWEHENKGKHGNGRYMPLAGRVLKDPDED